MLLLFALWGGGNAFLWALWQKQYLSRRVHEHPTCPIPVSSNSLKLCGGMSGAGQRCSVPSLVLPVLPQPPAAAGHLSWGVHGFRRSYQVFV